MITPYFERRPSFMLWTPKPTGDRESILVLGKRLNSPQVAGSRGLTRIPRAWTRPVQVDSAIEACAAPSTSAIGLPLNLPGGSMTDGHVARRSGTPLSSNQVSSRICEPALPKPVPVR
jgi:hypothetical protein